MDLVPTPARCWISGQTACCSGSLREELSTPTRVWANPRDSTHRLAGLKVLTTRLTGPVMTTLRPVMSVMKRFPVSWAGSRMGVTQRLMAIKNPKNVRRMGNRS